MTEHGKDIRAKLLLINTRSSNGQSGLEGIPSAWLPYGMRVFLPILIPSPFPSTDVRPALQYDSSPCLFPLCACPPPLFYMLRLLNFNSIWCLLPRGPEQTQIFVYDLFYLTLYMQDSSMSNSFIKKSNYIPIRLLKFY